MLYIMALDKKLRPYTIFESVYFGVLCLLRVERRGDSIIHALRRVFQIKIRYLKVNGFLKRREVLENDFKYSIL